MSARAVNASFRAVIVDDEPAGRDAVRMFLEETPNIEIVGEATNGRDAIRLVRAEEPDLLFLDIQMPDQDGFAVIEALGDQVPAGVVLVTAYGEYAQRAFEVHAVDYVVKPFGRPRFGAAIGRALHRLEADRALGMRETLSSLVESLRLDRTDQPGPGAFSVDAVSGASPDRIGVRIGHRTVLISVPKIDWVEADGDLVRVHVGDEVHLLSSRMREIESSLPAPPFFRIHRSSIVNLTRLKELQREGDGGGAVALSNGVRLRVARGRWTALERALGLSGLPRRDLAAGTSDPSSP